MAHENADSQGRITQYQVQAKDQPVQPAEPTSPQGFYAEITRRPDVSELLHRLAR